MAKYIKYRDGVETENCLVIKPYVIHKIKIYQLYNDRTKNYDISTHIRRQQNWHKQKILPKVWTKNNFHWLKSQWEICTQNI